MLSDGATEVLPPNVTVERLLASIRSVPGSPHDERSMRLSLRLGAGDFGLSCEDEMMDVFSALPYERGGPDVVLSRPRDCSSDMLQHYSTSKLKRSQDVA